MSGDPICARQSDEELVVALADGGATRGAAWNELVSRHSPSMYAVARSFRIDRATCEDLVQMAWLRMIERTDQLREPGSVRPWLCMVVRNEARKLVTRTRTVPVGEQWDRVEDLRLTPVDHDLISEERASMVRSAFAKLGEECRQLIRLTLVDPPLSYDEIAVAVGRPRGSLGPTRRRCLDRLAALLHDGER